MYAMSLLGSVRHVERHGAQLLELQTITGRETEARLLDAMEALVDLAELLRATAPFPLAQHGQRVENVVSRFLQAQYEQPSPSPEAIDDACLETGRAEAAITTGESWFVVPLGSRGPRAKNWGPLLDLVQRQTSELLEMYERVAGRIKSAGASQRLVDACHTVIEMIDTLATAVGQIVATTGYVTYRADDDGSSLLDAIKQKTAAFTGDTDA